MNKFLTCLAKVLAFFQSEGKAYRVRLDAERILCRRTNEEEVCITWDELERVTITIADINLYQVGVLWALYGGGKVMTFPDDARGAPELTRRLACLPGFNADVYAAAFAHRRLDGQVVWKRKPDTDV